MAWDCPYVSQLRVPVPLGCMLVIPLSTEQGDTVSVLREFDEVLFDKATPDNYMGLLDASSLLWRLDVMGVEPGEKRWARVTEAMATRGNSFRSSW